MSDWSAEEIRQLQSEAKKRVMAMRERSRFAAEDMNRGIDPPADKSFVPDASPRVIRMPVEYDARPPKECGGAHEERKTVPPSGETAEEKKQETVPSADGGAGAASSTRSMSGDELERLFLLSLCLLLGSERADHETLLALMYIMS